MMQTESVTHFRIRQDVQAMHAYAIQDSAGMAKLDAMENPYQLPPVLQVELGLRLGALAINRYPGARVDELRAALGRYARMPAGCALMLGNGSDELISLLALACAWLVDASAAASGAVRYAAAPLGWTPPLWIMALWAAFAMTLTNSMRFLLRHPALPALFGLLLAPLAYLSAARGFEAVRFTAPLWQGLLVLGVGWSIALSLLCMAARRDSRTLPPPLAGAPS